MVLKKRPARKATGAAAACGKQCTGAAANSISNRAGTKGKARQSPGIMDRSIQFPGRSTFLCKERILTYGLQHCCLWVALSIALACTLDLLLGVGSLKSPGFAAKTFVCLGVSSVIMHTSV